MSILSFKMSRITRRQTRTVVAAAAYRSGSRLFDQRMGREADFTDKEDVIHSALMVPRSAEHLAADRGDFWNAVDRREKRCDALLAYDFIASLPPDLERDDQVTVARGFAHSAFVGRGFGVDLNIHMSSKLNGSLNPHAHLMVTTRTLAPQSPDDDLVAALDKKMNPTIRDLFAWRETFTDHANARLALRNIDRRLDPRSFRKQGLAIEPSFRLSISSKARLDGGRPNAQGLKRLEVAGRNGDRIIADPLTALRAISREQTVFTESELTRFLGRHAEDHGQLDIARARVLGDANVVDLGRDASGVRCFASKEEVVREAAVIQAGERLHKAGRLTVHDTSDRAVVIAHAQLCNTTVNVLVPSPESRRGRDGAGGRDAMSALSAQTSLDAGALKGGALVIMESHLLRSCALQPFLAAAERGDLILHLAGEMPSQGAVSKTGAAFRALHDHVATSTLRDQEPSRGDRSADNRAGEDFARLRGLTGAEGPCGLSNGITPRRQREAGRALERRRAVLNTRKAKLERADPGGGDPASVERRLQILEGALDRSPPALEL